MAKQCNSSNKSFFRKVVKTNLGKLKGAVVGVPLYVLANALGPVCIKALQENLMPKNLFDCGFSDSSFWITKLSILDGLKKLFSILYPYWIVVGLGQTLRSFSESLCSASCIDFGVSNTSALLDLLFNKMMRLSETAKNVNAQGSLTNILFTDTAKIQTFSNALYMVVSIFAEFIISVVYLAVFVSPATLLGAAFSLVIFPTIFLIAKNSNKYL